MSPSDTPTLSRSSSQLGVPGSESSALSHPTPSAASSAVSLAPSDMAAPIDGKEESEESKFKQLLSVLKKTIGVKDLGAMRLSLPATLLHPMPNLEYWNYLDRADLFAAIDESDDPIERMLAVARWSLTKESKFIHGPLVKPYNSVLGERFRCIFEVTPATVSGGKLEIFESTPLDAGDGSTTPASKSSTGDSDDLVCLDPSRTEQDLEAASRAMDRALSGMSLSGSKVRPESAHTTSTTSTAAGGSSSLGERNPSTAATSSLSVPSSAAKGRNLARVAFLNEQVSHHPPVSCFFYESRIVDGDRKGKGRVLAYGVDQISARFGGTSVKVFPGPYNKGIYVSLPERQEEYEVTHPCANIAGLLRASPYVVVSDHCYITCRGPQKKRYRMIISYIDDGWLGKARYAIEGVVHEIEGDGKKEKEWTKIKHVPANKIVAKIEGCWKGEIKVTRMPKGAPTDLLVDISQLPPLSKKVRDVSAQDPEESQRFWLEVSEAIRSKKYSEATRVKQVIEQKQRDIATERKCRGEEFVPLYFQENWTEEGRPELTEMGKKALERELMAVGY